MSVPIAKDTRSPERIAMDEAIAAEPMLPLPELPEGVKPRPMEEGLRQLRRPVAIAGIVENGLVRPLDPNAKLTERSRVIIVATESTCQ